ncbi:MAG: lycopene cyclase domain-containing protein [Anaerolineales bacterium]|jgi:lycopene cyclase domain-containing protein
MSYGQFLFVFLGLPLIGVMAALLVDRQGGRELPASWRNLPAGFTLALHVLLAVTYTTPWDNYLVATGVWFYDPALVTGITLGWVPIEEYTFFVLQTILTGLWLLWLARRIPAKSSAASSNSKLRWGATLALGLVWLLSLVPLLAGWQPGTYLSLILAWALPPIMLQLAFGADILWKNARLVALALLTPTVFLAAADSLAILSGTWTIAPHQSLNYLIAGILPLEEFVFFLVTNTLVVFGMTLALSCESRSRLQDLRQNLRMKRFLIQNRQEFQK